MEPTRAAHSHSGSSSRSSAREDRTRTPAAYRVLDEGSGLLILVMAVAAPWLFGTTEAWSVWAMNIASYLLGAALIAKHVLRRVLDFSPPRVTVDTAAHRVLRWSFLAANILVLAYCLTAALNARATFLPQDQTFDYRESIAWLPSSYDARLTWFTFWQYLGLFCFFWSVRDWLIGRPKSAQRKKRRSQDAEELLEEKLSSTTFDLPKRLKLLLWVLCLNGMALALQGILQRLDGSGKLLWIRPSWWGTPESCFGPYSYRSNAASYINLIWPVAFGFWWILHQAHRASAGQLAKFGQGAQTVLLPATVVMAAAPFISASRGGAIIAVFCFVLIMGTLLFHRGTGRATRLSLSLLAAVIAIAALLLGWEQLAPRLRHLETDKWSNRGEIYENSERIAADFLAFGAGPGAFRSVYHLYRTNPRQDWFAFVHDDWLETQVTFGAVGTAFVLLNLVLLAAYWIGAGRTSAPPVLPAALWIALGGCLLHARFDFPFQIYSILMLFVLLCAILFSFSRKPTPESRAA